MDINTTKIKEDFIKVIQFSQSMKTVKVDKLFEEWLRAKSFYIKAWNNQLIYELPGEITFDLSDKDKKKRLKQFIDYIEEMYDNSDLAEFLEENKDDFFNNHLSEEYNKYGIVIPKGTKIIKAFKYFESAERPLHDLQTRASMIIQENKIKGRLCFSVHPLDFLSLSENADNWRSCHALDGEYRAGNLSYMLDSSTVICYLKHGDDLVKLPNFPEDVLWNSKKWRMLLFLSEDRQSLFAGRQYPFASYTALDAIQPLFLGSVRIHSSWTKWFRDGFSTVPGRDPDTSEAVLYGRHVSMRHTIYSLENIIEDISPLHFNDLLYSSYYKPHYCWDRYYNSSKDLKFKIGSQVSCLCCESNPIKISESMMCINCEEKNGTLELDDFTYCACCERRVYRLNTWWVETIDDLVCEDCYRRECRSCDLCGDIYYNSDITYDHETNEYLCPICSRRGE